MRFGRLALVAAIALTSLSMSIPAAAPVPPEQAAAARRLMELGLAQEQTGENRRAVTTFTRAIATRALSRPDEARATFNRGVALDTLGRTAEAIVDYTRAIRLDPELAPALNNRANAYRRLGRLEAAKRDYMAALGCPGGAREYPFYGLGLIAQKGGDAATARDYFQKALAINPSFSLASQSLASLSRPALAFVEDAPTIEPRPPARVSAARGSLADAGTHPRLRQMITDIGGSPAGGGAVVQLGAYRDEQTALEGWRKVVAASGDVLDGLSPFTVVVDLPGKGRFWRLRTAVNDKLVARKLCQALEAEGQACLVARD